MTYDWQWARGEMHRARDKQRGRALKTNQSTYLRVSYESPTDDWRSDECVYGLFLWGTEIVRYYPNGITAAGLNGWGTVTTKARIKEFSPMNIFSERDTYYGCCGGAWFPGDESTWFYVKEGNLCFQDGTHTPPVLWTRMPKPIPKRRDTVERPLPGDAFREGPKMWVCATDRRHGSRIPKLYPYLGDFEDDRRLTVTVPGWREQARDMLTPLEQLSRSQDAVTLVAIERFTWKKPV